MDGPEYRPRNRNPEMTQVYGSFSRRCLARLIDFGVVLAACGSLYLVNRSLGFPVKYSSLFYYYPPESFEMFMNSDLPGVLTTFVCIKLLVVFPYFALMESSRWQGTLGKLVMQIKVTDLNGERISFGRATGRYFLKVVSSVLFMLGYVIAFSDQRQTWHDYLSKTLVLRKNIFPAYYVMPRLPSRWMFNVPSFILGRRSDQFGAEPSGYTCLFCHHHTAEKHVGCPKCGSALYANTDATKAIMLMNGIIFTLIGSVAMFLGFKIVMIAVHGDYIPWFVFAIVFGFGGLFITGGIAGLLGRSWLVGLLLVLAGAGRLVAPRKFDKL
jgi:uncharacterized RDD family membrane protein YckC